MEFSKEEIQMPKKRFLKSSRSLAIREIERKDGRAVPGEQGRIMLWSVLELETTMKFKIHIAVSYKDKELCFAVVWTTADSQSMENKKCFHDNLFPSPISSPLKNTPARQEAIEKNSSKLW